MVWGGVWQGGVVWGVVRGIGVWQGVWWGNVVREESATLELDRKEWLTGQTHSAAPPSPPFPCTFPAE